MLCDRVNVVSEAVPARSARRANEAMQIKKGGTT